MIIYRDKDGNICLHKKTETKKNTVGKVRIELKKCSGCGKHIERRTINAETGKTLTIEPY
jgi:hypothetical protein